MTTREEMNKSVENLKEELRKRGNSLAKELESNIATMQEQAYTLRLYKQKYENGHITLLELVDMQEALVKAIPSLLLDYTYGRAKQAYKDLDADITNIQNFVNTLE